MASVVSAAWGDLEYRVGRCPVEVSVSGLDQRREGVRAALFPEAGQCRQRTTGGDLEYRAANRFFVEDKVYWRHPWRLSRRNSHPWLGSAPLRGWRRSFR